MAKLKTADFYRAEAERVRRQAEGMADAGNREALLKIARQYEELADRMQRLQR